jgi:serine/threonine protein kinase
LGDIKPENILVNLSGDIKLVNIYSWPNELPSYAKALDKKKLCYSILLAPEDIFLFSKGASDNHSNQLS